MSETRKPIPRAPNFDPEVVKLLTIETYKRRLEDDCAGNVERMIAADKDAGQKLEARAQAYSPIVRAVLRALEDMQKETA